MKRETRRVRLRAALVVVLATAAAAAGRADEGGVDFRRDVVPLLQQRCFRCHEGRDARAPVRLDVKAALLGEGGGPALVVAGQSRHSRLIEVVRSTDAKLRMPPEGPPLRADEVALLARWIDAGLPWDGAVLPERADARDHWAFRPIRRPPVPTSPDDSWSRTPVDRFLAAAQRFHQVGPAAEADRRTLCRRLHLDLWGLPPTWEDLAAFVADERPDAVERLVDRLLAAPQYGERWGRHWLDVARWAESEGFESNHPRPFAWRFRDYVVQAFNADRSFAEFVREQVAGDELPDYADERLIATGFLAAARISSNEEDKWLQRNDVTVDVVNAVGSALLGLTLHCAQCHDHKFDPLSTHDYYALHAFFARGMPVNVQLQDAAVWAEYERRRRPAYEQAVALQQTLFADAQRRAAAETRAQLTAEELHAYELPPAERTPEQERLARKTSLKFQKAIGTIEKYVDPADRKLYDELKKRIAEQSREAPPTPQTFAFYSPVTSPHALTVLPSVGFYPLPYEPRELRQLKTYVMVRGDVHQLGVDVAPGFPAVLAAKSSAAPPTTRRELADWLTSPEQPLVARVWVNRLWQHHFGRGIVATPDDFGVRGARPTHPELLDWLAAELRDSGWSTKHMHRLIVTSAAYRQSATAAADVLQRDPENRWLTRWSPRRLESEALRDAWLAASGELDAALGGSSVPVEHRETSRRRSLYLFQRRGHAADMQRLFDGPQECAASLAARDVSTSPLQSLYLLNSEFSVQRARAAAEQLPAAGADASAQVQAAFRRILLRDPDSEERAAALELHRTGDGWDLLCQALLNLNEFMYVE